MTDWSLYAHGADVGIRGEGPTPAAAFVGAALALTAAICDPSTVQPRARIEVRCEAPDLEQLLYEWINTLVYEMTTRHMLFGRYEARIDGTTLRAAAWGEDVDVARHQPAAEVKGATFTDLAVRETSPGHWVSQCIVDV